MPRQPAGARRTEGHRRLQRLDHRRPRSRRDLLHGDEYFFRSVDHRGCSTPDGSGRRAAEQEAAAQRVAGSAIVRQRASARPNPAGGRTMPPIAVAKARTMVRLSATVKAIAPRTAAMGIDSEHLLDFEAPPRRPFEQPMRSAFIRTLQPRPRESADQRAARVRVQDRRHRGRRHRRRTGLDSAPQRSARHRPGVRAEPNRVLRGRAAAWDARSTATGSARWSTSSRGRGRRTG